MFEELIDTREVQGFTIHTFACEEDVSSEGQFASGDDAADAKIIEDIRAGNLTWFCAKVTASKAGVILSEDYLGACCYKSYDDFIKCGDYHADMIASVVSQATAKIKELAAC